MPQTPRPGLLIFVLILAGVVVTPVAAENDPISAFRATLWSPYGLGSSVLSPVRRVHPTTVLSLPHLSADVREALLGGSGGGVVGDGTAGGAIGVTVPLRRFVSTTAAGLLRDEEGYVGRVSTALARPLGSRLAAGGALHVTAARGSEDGEIGVGVDMGARYRLGAMGDLSRVEVHGALLGMGSAARRDDLNPVIAPFTPVVGARGVLVDADELTVHGAGSLRLERFSEPWINAGVGMRFSAGALVSLGIDVPLSASSARLWPGITVGFAVPTGGAARSDASLAVQPTSSGKALVGGEFLTAFPASDWQAPTLEISVTAPERSAVVRYGGGVDRSVSNGPLRVGLAPVVDREQLVVDVAVVDDRAVGGIQAALLAPNGETVRTWSPAPVGDPVVEGEVSARLTSDLSRRRFDATLVWDIGDAVGDGRYTLRLEGRDAAGNRTAAELAVMVDRTAPDVFMDVGVRRGGDGVGGEGQGTDDGVSPPSARDAIILGADDRVELVIEYGEAEVLAVEVVDQADRRVVSLDVVPDLARERVVEARWSGRGPSGSPVPDGVYRARATATDALGNRRVVTSPPITVSSRRPTFRLALSDTVVSPDGDGQRDVLTVNAELFPLPGLEEWTITLSHESPAGVVRTWSGIDLPPDQLELSGADLPYDGRYVLTARSRYANGSSAEDRTPSVLVDREAPEVTIALSNVVVAPVDDRRLVVFLEDDGTARGGRLLLDGDGLQAPLAVQEFEPVPESVEWSLVRPDGTFLPPGRYTVYAEMVDAAGNVGVSSRRGFELVPRLTGAEIEVLSDRFSPNGDGVRDEVTFALRGPQDLARGEFTVEISGAGGTRRFSGGLPLPDRIVWDGRDDAGVPFPDGEVTAALSVSAPDRGAVTAVSSPVFIDTQPPQVGVARDGSEFVSPDGDGVQDEIVVSLSGDVGTVVALEVVDSIDGGVVRRVLQSGDGFADPRRVVVEARGDDGTVLPDGSYGVRVVARDAAGNRTVTRTVPVVVDTRPVGGFLRLSDAAISPNDDGVSDALTIEPVVPDREGLEEWTFEIAAVPGEGNPVYTVGGTAAELPDAWTWPPEGESIPTDGTYRATFRGTYRHGPVLRTATPDILVDTAGPEVAVAPTPQPFSPDGDGRDDTVTFAVSVSDRSEVRYWLLEIFDPTGAFFYDVGGRGAVPRRVRWDGRARNGERVVSAETYPWRMEVADTLGNVTVTEGELTVDVLVEAFEGGYRIQIPSITFPPNSPQLILDAEDPRGRRNREVLDRLVEILGRFPDYSIVVEGHAVNISGTEREEERELLPLSQGRAEAVRRALIERGVAARLLSADGRGGRVPVVPHSDEQNRWKNRRVDFILQR